MEQNTAIALRHITKTFGKVVANHDISMEIRRGEVLSLLGENGSGKTTLMNMLAGIYFPDEGEILVDGTPVTIASPRDAFQYGIGMVHQHFKLVDIFTAAENIVLGLEESGKLDLKAAAARIREISDRYGFEIDPEKKVYDMSVSEKQTVEIVKVLYRGADILILDEPTAVLTPQETDRLFEVMRNMRADGKALVIITHKLHEVMEISDRVAVLRKGEYIGDVATGETDPQKLTDMMVGHATSLNIDRPEPVNPTPRLEVRDLTVYDSMGVKRLDSLSFTAMGGEILGIAGIAGSGQKELLEAIAGLQDITKGASILYHPVDGDGPAMELVGKTPLQISQAGVSLAFVPEDRLGMGLVGSLGMSGNMLLRSYRSGRGFFTDRKAPEQLAQNVKQELEVVTPSTSFPVRRLSGGNVQKVLVGREIAQAPSVLMTAYAVRGLDINTSYTIYHLLTEQKMKGVAVIYVGEDLDVLLELCDRILVLCGGQISGIVDARTTTKKEVGLLMTKFRKEGGRGMNREKHAHEPWVRIVKRDGIARPRAYGIRILAVLLSLVVSGVFIYAITGLNPIDIYEAMWEGAFGTSRRSWVTVRDAMMLLCIGIGLAPAFKMKFWNVGAEGQILIGGIMTAGIMRAVGDSIPTPALLVLMAVVSLAAGAAWGIVPAVFKAYWNTNETLFTLMMNYVAIQLTSYCVSLWENPVGSNTVGIINQTTQAGWFPAIFGQSYSLNVILVLILTVGMYLYLKYSKQGYEITVVGDSENTARYAGISVKKVTIRTMAISGAICAFAGFIAVAGSSHTISTTTAGGRGFTAIIVAWLAQFNSFVMVLISFLLVFLEKGATQIASQFNLNDYASEVITGIILFFILGSEFFINYRLVFRGKEREGK